MNIFKDKIVLMATAVVILGGFYALQEPTAESKSEAVVTETETMTDPVLRDREILESRLSGESVKSSVWSLVNQFDQPVNAVVNRSNAEDVVLTTQTIVQDLMKCLDVDFCGMEKDTSEDPYFDPTGTVAHKTIERSLNMLNEALKLDPTLKDQLNVDLLERVSEVPSEKIQSLVSDLVPSNSDEVAKVQSSLAKNTEGKSRTQLILNMSKDKKLDRSELVSLLQKTFSESDAYTVINVLESLPKYNLSEDELARTTIYLCRFKVDEYEHNWKAVKKNVEKVFSDFSKVCNE